MKTIRSHIAAGGMLAALASALLLAGSASAEDAGRVRLTDDPAQAGAVEHSDDLVVRGSSDIRQRNARTTAALKRLFSGTDAGVQSAAPVRQVRHEQVVPAGACCPADSCCAPTCAAPDDCCAPDSCAPECCAPDSCAPDCCAPDCCAPNNCCAPQGCCPQGDCGCPADECDCAPGCACPAGDCCCPDGCDCAPGSCACPDGGCCCSDACDGCNTAGRIRISDLFGDGGADACGTDGACRDGKGRRGSLRERRQARTCRHGFPKGECPYCGSRSLANRHCVSHFLGRHAAAHRARSRLASHNLSQYLHCKFGCLIHDGHGGVGSPLFGHYSVVYPVDPGHFDARDGGVYAAEGYGGAVSVPLAPTVRHAWNYGWGIPSSRLTPVSNTPAP